MRTAVLTISSSVSEGRAEDTSGPLLASLADEAGADVVAVEVLPDDQAIIEVRLRHHADDGCDLVFTTGGTGFTPDDVTPEATRAVIDRDAPGSRRPSAPTRCGTRRWASSPAACRGSPAAR